MDDDRGMTDVDLSISMVVYKPDTTVLAKVLSRLNEVLRLSQKHISLSCHLDLIDNSASPEWPGRLKPCLESNFLVSDTITSDLIVAEGNIGYGRGNNLAIQKTKARYHFSSNPDIFLRDNALIEAIAYLEQHPEVGLLVPDVHGEDGERHYLCKRNPTLFDMLLRGFAPSFIKQLFHKRMQSFEMRERNYDAVISAVEYPTGCFMFFRTGPLKKIGGFDPDYFLHLEDADIGRRMRAIAEVAYVPQVKIVHKWARGSHRSWKLRWITIKSAFIYWRKWGGMF
jgi:GT2 family glycosyltransferase